MSAYSEYARAGDLDPSNVDAHLRAGTILLLGREFEAAATRAELALKADPRHVPAHILLGNAKAGLNDNVEAMRRIQEAINIDSLIRASVDGARCGDLHWRPQGRRGGWIQEGGRARAELD